MPSRLDSTIQNLDNGILSKFPPSGDNISCGSVRYGLTPFVAILPAWFRFAQCLRRYYDTRQAFPHLVNAGKYSTTFFVVFFGSLASGLRGGCGYDTHTHHHTHPTPHTHTSHTPHTPHTPSHTTHTTHTHTPHTPHTPHTHTPHTPHTVGDIDVQSVGYTPTHPTHTPHSPHTHTHTHTVGDLDVQSIGYYISLALWIVAHIISTTYTFSWDIKMDWGLFEGKYKLRSELIYSHKVMSY